MKNTILIFSFILTFFVAIFFSVKLWFHMDFIDISTNGLLAIIFCVIFSLILGSFLMGLVFFSSRYGFDDQVDNDLDSVIDKHKKL